MKQVFVGGAGPPCLEKHNPLIAEEMFQIFGSFITFRQNIRRRSKFKESWYANYRGTGSVGSRKTLDINGKSIAYYSIPEAQEKGLGDFSRIPAALKVVLENMLRFEDGNTVTVDDIKAFADWAQQGGKNPREIAYRPARVLMQDFTGVPAVVDLAAMRDGIVGLGGDAHKINPLNPVDVVIDHSVRLMNLETLKLSNER